MKHEKPKIVSITGGKLKGKNNDVPDGSGLASINIEGEQYYFQNLILGGTDLDGKKVFITWEVTGEDMLVLLKMLDIVITDKVRDIP